MTDSSTGLDARALGRTLIDTFGQGWQKGNVDALLSVFATNAVFLDSPFGQPITGIDAIRSYWVDTPYHQAEITFSSGEIFTVGPWFSTEFKCTYRRRRTGEWVDTRGALFCETDGEQITEMRMYYHRWTGGREVPTQQ
jgi:ketosteroid isomerase-like protein